MNAGLKIMSATMLILVLASVTILATNEYSMTQQRKFSFTLTDWSGWVLQVFVTTYNPWIVGDEVNITIEVITKEAVNNSTLSITKVSILTDSLEFSKYLGVFKGKNENKSVSFSILLIDPAYANISQGEFISRMISIGIEGYVDTDGERIPHTAILNIPVDILALPSNIKLDISAPSEIKLGNYVEIGITLKNAGAASVYGITVSIYDNSTFVDERFIGFLPPDGLANVFLIFKPKIEGTHDIVVRASWTRQSGSGGVIIRTFKLRVKREINIYSYVNVSEVNVYQPIEINGFIVPTAKNLTVNIEGSIDGGFTWTVLGNVLTDNSGRFKFTWVPKETGLYVLRAHFLGSEMYYEAVSNTIRLSVLKATPKLMLNASLETIELGKKLKLKVTMHPPAPVKIVINYRVNESEWKTYATITLNNDGKGEIVWVPLALGNYYFIAKFEGSDEFHKAESNIITIKVTEQPERQNVTNTEVSNKNTQSPIFQEQQVRYIIMGVIVVSILAGVFLWVRGRRY